MKQAPQSGVVPWFRENGELRVVLITSSSGSWIFPKGLIEPDMTPLESALNEAEEEAGVLGRGNDTVVGEYRYEKMSHLCVVAVFTMEVTRVLDEWDEMWRQRWIGPPHEALGRIDDRQRESLLAALELVGRL